MKLRTLIRLAVSGDRTAGPDNSGAVRAAARRAAEAVRQDPRVQEAAAGLRGRVQELSSAARLRADRHLERLIEAAHTRQGEPVPAEVAALLARRREARETQARQLRARAALIALGDGPEQRRVLTLVAQATPWAGGEAAELRYTQILDRLASSGEAGAEMRVHRALWTLAERHVLAVSPHGRVSACPLAQEPISNQSL
ncbi:hypothetical protein Dgeo_2478 (plasmid) [Deinococcus geothermalis DSM 11300]|uniref:Uncharacterized protein n=1 Tax=Deinococcus geothermalis (strain DSM 11300 / CIP 105573 / AG-3a) TaxID=319795 RepID=Q1J3M2_DEIGD|nr:MULTISPECIES: hypothetical protein [Deinococcus]ABF43912.1 hypothetical protein Dgeo_2478 [Deinococcus geothermalis DSM 11300]MBI0446041.1 hypothetical protein [Deinococcus sp. DB0503]